MGSHWVPMIKNLHGVSLSTKDVIEKKKKKKRYHWIGHVAIQPSGSHSFFSENEERSNSSLLDYFIYFWPHYKCATATLRARFDVIDMILWVVRHINLILSLLLFWGEYCYSNSSLCYLIVDSSQLTIHSYSNSSLCYLIVDNSQLTIHNPIHIHLKIIIMTISN